MLTRWSLVADMGKNGRVSDSASDGSTKSKRSKKERQLRESGEPSSDMQEVSVDEALALQQSKLRSAAIQKVATAAKEGTGTSKGKYKPGPRSKSAKVDEPPTKGDKKANKKAKRNNTVCASDEPLVPLEERVDPEVPQSEFPKEVSDSESSSSSSSSSEDDSSDREGPSVPMVGGLGVSPPNDVMALLQKVAKDVATTAAGLAELKKRQKKTDKKLKRLYHQPAHLRSPVLLPQASRGESTSSFNSMSVEGHLHDRLPDKVKRDIWENRYVDFGDILDKGDKRYTAKFSPDGEGGIVWEPKARAPLSLSEWKVAFAIYQSCFLENVKEPLFSFQDYRDYSEDFSKYLFFICNLAEMKGDWAYYDQNFRKNRQTVLWRFSRTDVVLQNEALARRQGAMVTNSPTGQAQWGSRKFRDTTEVPMGYCFSFHSERNSCFKPNCLYKHRCYTCHGRHPAYKCSAGDFYGFQGRDMEKRQQRKHGNRDRRQGPPNSDKSQEVGPSARKFRR